MQPEIWGKRNFSGHHSNLARKLSNSLHPNPLAVQTAEAWSRKYPLTLSIIFALGIQGV